MARIRSLRQLLLGWLVAPLLAVLVVGAIIAYFIALRAATDAYDKALLDPVIAMADHIKLVDGHIEFDLPPIAQRVLMVDAYDRLYFQVTGPNGELISGNQGLPLPLQRTLANDPVFYDASYLGDQVRVAALRVPMANGGEVVIQAAETLVKRTRMVWEILLADLLPDFLVALAVLLLVWIGVGRGLKPLERLRAEIAARSHTDLRPVRADDAPEEVRPLLQTLNELLARLQATIEAQQRFLANAAHQLRTPLAGLQMQTELIARGQLPDELRGQLSQLQKATVKTAHLANQLLTLAHAEPARWNTHSMTDLDLQSIAEAAAAEWVPRALAKKIDLGFELSAAPLRGDPLLIRELLANLIDNAINYTPSGGHVTVRTRNHGGAVLEVEDNGLGIPEKARDRVFERFYRIEGTSGEGSGLGLAIVQEIAGLHDARLEITSAASGRGTLVVVRFPLASA